MCSLLSSERRVGSASVEVHMFPQTIRLFPHPRFLEPTCGESTLDDSDVPVIKIAVKVKSNHEQQIATLSALVIHYARPEKHQTYETTPTSGPHSLT